MNREIVIAKYINAVEKILVAFHLNIEPENEDIAIVTLKTKEFTNASTSFLFRTSKTATLQGTWYLDSISLFTCSNRSSLRPLSINP